MPLPARAAALTAAGGVAVAAWSTLVEPRWFALRRATVPVLPDGAPPLRVLHVSDLHLVPRQHRKRAWVRALGALEPDLVINTGDNLAHPNAPDALADVYGDLLERPGVFVLGSNDYFAPQAKNPLGYLTGGRQDPDSTPQHELPWPRMTHLFREAGWQDLTNARTRMQVGGLDLELVGVDDPHLGRDRYAAVAGPADPTADVTIGVTHAPYQRVLDAMTADGARLLVAGHTHGGQICLPLVGTLVTNCDLDRHRARGVSRWWPGAGRTPPPSSAPPDAAWLQVSAGLGGSPYAPYRLACRPEATLLTLVARDHPGP